jgi:hypothetical protein
MIELTLSISYKNETDTPCVEVSEIKSILFTKFLFSSIKCDCKHESKYLYSDETDENRRHNHQISNGNNGKSNLIGHATMASKIKQA